MAVQGILIPRDSSNSSYILWLKLKFLQIYRYPLIDANMKELSATGFMSNRGRQVIEKL